MFGKPTINLMPVTRWLLATTVTRRLPDTVNFWIAVRRAH